MAIRFSWDPKKAKRNLQVHKLAFEVAQNVFSDPNAMFVEDLEKDGEVRYHAIGFANQQLLAVVVYLDLSEDEDEERIHIISARKAEAFEEKLYAKQFI